MLHSDDLVSFQYEAIRRIEFVPPSGPANDDSTVGDVKGMDEAVVDGLLMALAWINVGLGHEMGVIVPSRPCKKVMLAPVVPKNAKPMTSPRASTPVSTVPPPFVPGMEIVLSSPARHTKSK
jgi:hypothetical protein